MYYIMESPTANVNITIEAEKKPNNYKNCGRKPKVFKDGKPIDPQYYVNYYHDVIKKRETLCPYCDRKFACQRNLKRHLVGGKETAFCHRAHKRALNPDEYNESESSSSFDDYLRAPMTAPIREGSMLDEYIKKQTYQPKSEAEWFQAGWAMINMLMQAQKEKNDD